MTLLNYKTAEWDVDDMMACLLHRSAADGDRADSCSSNNSARRAQCSNSIEPCC